MDLCKKVDGESKSGSCCSVDERTIGIVAIVNGIERSWVGESPCFPDDDSAVRFWGAV